MYSVYLVKDCVCLTCINKCLPVKDIDSQHCFCVRISLNDWTVSLQSLPEVLSSHQVRVQVKACGLSPLDLKVLKAAA